MRPSRENACWPMVFDGGFRVREADAKTDGKCHRGQARRARQEPDGQRVEREIRVFPALALTGLRTTNVTTLMRALASLWDLWRGATAERSKSHSLAFDRPRKIWKTRRGFQVWRGSSGQSLNTSAMADTLLTEDFLEAGGSSDRLKKVWRKPAAVLLRRQSAQERTLSSSD